MEVLHEIYFGREPVAPLQAQLTKLRKKLAGKPVTSTTNLDVEILKFNRIAESIFGFKSFALYIQPDNIPNAYAFPVDTYFTDEEKLKIYHSLMAAPTGFKYNAAFQSVSLIVAINSGMFDDYYFTDDEIMATILHEIGHGFFEAVTNKDNQYTIARKITQAFRAVNSFALDKVKKGKHVTKEIINKEINSLDRLTSGIKSGLANLKLKLFKESMDDNMKSNRVQYTNEKFADSFPTMYGYSAEQYSVDLKTCQLVGKLVHGVKTYPKIIETIKMYHLYFKDLIEYMTDKQDEHPAELARIMTTVAQLKRELAKDSIDPKMKRELTEQLNNVYKLIEDTINYPKDEDSMRIIRLYYIKLYEKFGGDRREKDTDNDALFDAIDKRYNDLKNGKEE